jgi:hypothetical protein
VYHTHRSLYDRSLEKTPEQVFINTLRKDFELSPAESKGVLELAKECLFGEVPKTLGKVKILCASLSAKHGKPLGEQEMVRVELTLDGGVEDLDVLRRRGSAALRQLKVLRISEEAYEQGGLLTQEDIGRVLQVSRKTRHSPFSIKRYVVTFGRLLLLLDKKVTNVVELSRRGCQVFCV